MQKNNIVLLFLAAFFLPATVLLTACGKEGVQIGYENPEQEMQKCLKLSKKRAYEETVECLEIFKSRFAETKWGEEAELKIADTYFQQKEYLLAAETYQTFIKIHPTHRFTDYAQYMTGHAYLQKAPKSVDRDQQYVQKALDEFKIFLTQFPNSPYLKSCLNDLKIAEDKIARRLFYIGRFYYRTGEYKSAIPRLHELSEKFPDSLLLPKTLYLLASAHIRLKQFEEARQSVEKLVINFPKNIWTKKAQKRYLGAIN